jgi:hypothetical protein
MEQMNLIKSSRNTGPFGLNGNQGVVGELHNYVYHFDKQSKNGERYYWICAERHAKACKARLTTDLSYVVTKNDFCQHTNHGPSQTAVNVRVAMVGLKRSAAETMDATSSIVDRMRQGMILF